MFIARVQQNPNHRQRTMILLTGIAGWMLTSMSVAAGTRLSFVYDAGNGRAAKLAELAQANLGENAGVELLERTQVQQILKEQKLSLSGALDASQAIAIGKLLTVDLIATVECSREKESVPGIVIFDSRSGVRYEDAALPASESHLEQSIAEILRCVHAAIRKREGGAGAVHTVGITSIRNADLPRRDDSLCETVGLLVERGLTRSADLAILERRRLSSVNDERTLPIQDAPQGLLASLTTVELEISRSADGRGLQATARWKSADGRQTDKVMVTVSEPSSALLAESLLQKLIESLQAAPVVVVGDPRAEARRFDAEASHDYSHRQFAAAVRAQEAAVALDPTNLDFTERLAEYLVRFATYQFSPSQINIVDGGNWKQTIVDPAVLDALLENGTRGVDINMGSTRPSAHHPPFNQTLVYLCYRLNGFRSTAAPEVQAKIDSFFRLCRTRSENHIESWALQAESNPRNLDRYLSAFQMECALLYAFSIDTQQYAATMLPVSSRWVAVTKDWQPEFSKTNGGSQLNMLLSAIVTGQRTFYIDQAEYLKVMKPLFGSMRQHSRPIVRLYGVLGQIRAGILLREESEETGFARFASEYRSLAQEIYRNPEPWNPELTRFEVWSAWLDAIERLPSQTPRAIPGKVIAQELLAMCQFLLDRNELKYPVIQQIPWRIDHAAAYPLIVRMSELVDSPRFVDPERDKARIRSLLNTIQQDLLQKHPEFAAGPADVPWWQARKIFDVQQFNALQNLIAPQIIGQAVYGFGFEYEDNRTYLRLIKVSLSGAAAQRKSRIELDQRPGSLTVFQMNHFIPSVSLDGNTLFAATDGAGIAVFPLDEGAAYRIGIEAGLPSDKVTSVACLDRKLYAGAGDGYLIGYDLHTGQCEIVASSRRKEKLSAFDDRAPFRVPYMVRDPARKRIVILIGDGLWQIVLPEGKLKEMVDLQSAQTGRWNPKLSGNHLGWGSPVRNDRILLSTVFEAIEIDLKNDRAELIHSPDHGTFQIVPPHLLLNGSLWSAYSFGRLSLQKRRQQKFALPGYGDYPFQATQCLELLGNGRQLLVGDDRSLWLLELKEHEQLKDQSAAQ